MSSFARTLLRSTTRAARPQAAVAPLRASARRGYSSAPPKSSNAGLYLGLTTAALGGGAYYLYSTDQIEKFTGLKLSGAGPMVPGKEDYQKVYNTIADILENNDYDDGSYGPVSTSPRPPFKQFIPDIPG